MGLLIIREKTTKVAIAKIKKLLDEEDFTSALLLASIYVHMRLKTLITLRLNPPQELWRDISDAFNSANSTLGYYSLLSVCNKLGLVQNQDKNKLKKLWTMRNSVAHETELWKAVSGKKQNDIVELCDCACKFLKNTNN